MRCDSALLTIEPARPDELERAFQMVFAPLGPADHQSRALSAVEMVRRGELDPSGVLIARSAGKMLGAVVSASAAGACGLIWPPATTARSGRLAVEDQLVKHATAWLRERGTKFAQALIAPAENHQAAALLRNGFSHITNLIYMRHDLAMLEQVPSGQLEYRDFGRGEKHLFRQTLQRTYEGANDCPEINGVRTMDEIIAGHMAQGKHDPSRWWLVLEKGIPAGVLLLTEFIDAPIWDLTYVGVLPEFRGKGIGRELIHKAIRTVHSAGGLELTLAVDERNVAAIRLYREMGFEAVEKRHAYLAIWPTVR